MGWGVFGDGFDESMSVLCIYGGWVSFERRCGEALLFVEEITFGNVNGYGALANCYILRIEG